MDPGEVFTWYQVVIRTYPGHALEIRLSIQSPHSWSSRHELWHPKAIQSTRLKCSLHTRHSMCIDNRVLAEEVLILPKEATSMVQGETGMDRPACSRSTLFGNWQGHLFPHLHNAAIVRVHWVLSVTRTPRMREKYRHNSTQLPSQRMENHPQGNYSQHPDTWLMSQRKSKAWQALVQPLVSSWFCGTQTRISSARKLHPELMFIHSSAGEMGSMPEKSWHQPELEVGKARNKFLCLFSPETAQGKQILKHILQN